MLYVMLAFAFAFAYVAHRPVIRQHRFGPRGNDYRSEPADEVRWRRDPLAHPAIRAMSQREIADLPFDPWTVERS